MSKWKLKNLNVLRLSCYGYSDDVLAKKKNIQDYDFLELIYSSIKKACRSKILRVGYAKELNYNYNILLDMMNNYMEDSFDENAEYLAKELEKLIGYNFKDRNIVFVRVESEDFCGMLVLFLGSKEDFLRDLKKDSLDIHKALTVKQTGSIDLALIFSVDYETGLFRYISKEAVDTEHDPVIISEFLNAETKDDRIKRTDTLYNVCMNFADLNLKPDEKILMPKALNTMGDNIDIDHLVDYSIPSEKVENFKEVIKDRNIIDGKSIDGKVLNDKIKKVKLNLTRTEIDSDKISITVPECCIDRDFIVSTVKKDKDGIEYVEIKIKGFTNLNFK